MKNRLYDKMYNDITQTELKSKFDYDVKNGWLIRKFKSGKSKPCGHKPTRHGYGCICISPTVLFGYGSTESSLPNSLTISMEIR